ncbi:MAG: glycosyltransferase [Coriobacteriia bacterium]|nr:glycosyltransferase [Coriobacteriia bacterium]
MVNKYLPFVLGGIESHMGNLARELTKAHIADVHLLGAQAPERLHRLDFDLSGVSFEELQTSKLIANTPIAPSLSQKLIDLSEQADILHFHMPYPYADYAYLKALHKHSKLSKKPLVISYHSDIVRQKFLKQMYKPVMHSFLSRADAIVVSSPQLQRSSDALKKYQNKVFVVPFGCDTEFFGSFTGEDKASERMAQRKKLSLTEPESPLTLFVGRLVYYKGIDVLLNAFTAVPGTLVIVGTGPYKTQLVEQTLDLGLQHRVHFVPSMSAYELALTYAAADLLVLPSIANSEAFGLVQIEAHAAATPTVASRLATGVSFATSHGEDGILVEPNKPDALARAINVLYQNPSYLSELAKNAKNRAQKLFSYQNMCQGFANIYDSLL